MGGGGIDNYCNNNHFYFESEYNKVNYILLIFSSFVPGILKFVLLCDVFTKHKSDLSREERQEIIQHCRKRCEILETVLNIASILCCEIFSDAINNELQNPAQTPVGFLYRM